MKKDWRLSLPWNQARDFVRWPERDNISLFQTSHLLAPAWILPISSSELFPRIFLPSFKRDQFLAKLKQVSAGLVDWKSKRWVRWFLSASIFTRWSCLFGYVGYPEEGFPSRKSLFNLMVRFFHLSLNLILKRYVPHADFISWAKRRILVFSCLLKGIKCDIIAMATNWIYVVSEQ